MILDTKRYAAVSVQPLLKFTDRFYQYARLTRADKPIGTLLLLWPMLWALWFCSAGEPNLKVLVVFVIGTFLMRSAGCAVNDFADRQIDGAVHRTRNRPLATGVITPREAVLVAAGLAFVSFLLVLTMNPLTVKMSVLGLLLAAVYPFSKRFFHWPQLVLGLAFGWAVPMVVAAQTNALPWVAWQVYLAAIIWALAYDTIYAMVDREDDLKIGVKSTAILFGRFDVAIVTCLQVVVLLLIGWTGRQHQMGTIFYLGLALAGLVVVRQIQLIWARDPPCCFRAFLLNNHMGFLIFCAIVVDYLI